MFDEKKIVPIFGSEFPDKVIPLINKAQHSLDILVYDWRFYSNSPAHRTQQFNLAILRAKDRGVTVRAILNDSANLDLFNSLGIKARKLRNKRTNHAKFLMIDKKIVVIGSHNYTSNAFNVNLETSVAFEIPEGETRYMEFFENLYNFV